MMAQQLKGTVGCHLCNIALLVSSCQKFFVLLSTEFPHRQNPVHLLFCTIDRTKNLFQVVLPLFQVSSKNQARRDKPPADSVCIYSEGLTDSLLPFSDLCYGDMDFCHMQIILVFHYISKEKQFRKKEANLTLFLL